MIKAGGRFIGEATIEGLSLHEYCSGFPATQEAEGYSVKGEIYEVNQKGLKRLDMLESEGRFYHRVIKFTTEGEKVMVYIMKGEGRDLGPLVEDGDWRGHKENDFIAWFDRDHRRPRRYWLK
tara:strand:+ start:288 stop:653 length:366 start_codon:yes stop_codon:yes gene_type:complete